MIYRRFGKTELQLPVLTLGGMRFAGGWNEPHDQVPDETLENAKEMVRYSLQKGINHFETARGYMKSELAYGLVFKELGIKQEDIIITTKIPPTETYGEMRQFIEESLEYLHVEYIDNFDILGLNVADDLDLTMKKGGGVSRRSVMP